MNPLLYTTTTEVKQYQILHVTSNIELILPNRSIVELPQAMLAITFL